MIYKLFASCPRGVEDLLAGECSKLGVDQVQQQTGGIAFEGSLEHAYSLCLWSRVASRVLLKLDDFPVNDYDDLYAGVKGINWLDHMDDDDNSFAIDCFSSHDELSNSHYATLKVKDAIVDQFVELNEVRPSVERERPDIRINVYISKTDAVVYLDLAGEPLHIRGYRQHGGEAPLKENLAAAILLRCKWPDFVEHGHPMTDPMCGSGTLLIEAAYIAGDIAPGLLRSYYGFYHWKMHDKDLWENLVDAAKSSAVNGKKKIPGISGSDDSEKVLKMAQMNIDAAGLSDHIKLGHCEVRSARPVNDSEAGLLVCNPPYGKRLGQIEQLKNLYTQMGQTFREYYPGWKVSVFTDSAELAKCIALRSHHKNSLYNGAIKCTLFHYNISSRKYIPPVDKGITADRKESVTMFENRLRKNHKHLSKWARKNSISCYRVYDADLPEYSMAIDLYEDWVHVQEYDPPKTIDSKIAENRFNDALEVMPQALGIESHRLVVKKRKIQSGGDQYQRQDKKNQRLLVHEAGLTFKVNLYDYLDTGLFPDHRNIRALIKNTAKNKSFLNLFAYTGVASVYAASGGARTTTTVDMSNTYLDWARENMKLNDYTDNRHQFVRADCLQWVWDAKRAGQRYQLIFLDPPTFSNSNKMTDTLDLTRDHVELIERTMRLLEDDGIMFFSTNARRFKLNTEALEKYSIQDISQLSTSEDYRKKPLHKCWCIRKSHEVFKLSL